MTTPMKKRNDRMNVVFFGTPDFAVPTLKALVDGGYDVRAVVTQPDKPKGRSKELCMSSVKEEALLHGIPVIQPTKVRTPEFVEEIRSFKPDVIVVVAFGRILVKDIIDMPPYGCINVHSSLLPKYRGAAPIQWAVVNGDKVSGVTTMLMDEGLDTGDILMQREIPIDANETGGSLFDKLKDVGAELLIETLKAIETGSITRIPQNDLEASHVEMIKKEDGHIDFTKSADQIECMIRGFSPWPSAYTFLDGKMLKIWSASPSEKEYEGKCGEIVEISKDIITIKTGKGSLNIKELQLEGKKRMDTASFLRGTKLDEHVVLG